MNGELFIDKSEARGSSTALADAFGLPLNETSPNPVESFEGEIRTCD